MRLWRDLSTTVCVSLVHVFLYFRFNTNYTVSALLWPNGVQYEKLKLLYSDAAPYMIKCANSLKIFYPQMIHFTCLAHALHRVCELIRNQYGDVDGLISSTKKVFLKAPLRVEIYQEKLPNVPLPPQPILIRWGTWLEAALFYSEHFLKIKQVCFNRLNMFFIIYLFFPRL